MSIFLSTVYDRARRASEFDYKAELSGAVNNTFKTAKAVSSSTRCFWFSDLTDLPPRFFQTIENFVLLFSHVCRITLLFKVRDLL